MIKTTVQLAGKYQVTKTKKMFGIFNKKLSIQSGFTLVEAVIYGALLAILVVVVIGGLLRLGTAYAKIQNTRKVNAVGTFVLDRIVREARNVDANGLVAGIVDNGDTDSIAFDINASFAELVKADGAVAHWDFNEADGNALDNIGGNDGVVRNIDQTRGVPAIVGFGYDFDSDNYDEVDFPNDAFSSHSEGAVEIIFSTSLDNPAGNGSGYLPLFTLSQEGSPELVDQAVFIGVHNQEILVAKRREGFVFQEVWLKGATAIEDGTYYHAVLETSNALNKTELYVNGIKDTPYFFQGGFIGPTHNNNSSWFDTFPDLHNFAAGSFIDPTSNGEGPEPERTSFDGIIDEIVIYDKPKSEAVWTSHYNVALGADTTIERSIHSENDSLFLTTTSPNGNIIQEQLTDDQVTVTAFNIIAVGTNLARISITLEVGNGDAKVEQTFVQVIGTRNIPE